MAAVIGKPIKVDINTLKIERGKFAQIYVEIDLNQPVVRKVWLKDRWCKVQYEGLHIICSECECMVMSRLATPSNSINSMLKPTLMAITRRWGRSTTMKEMLPVKQAWRET
ncbi:hypothetical protein L6164_005531 [Bauhinia variegata]|uniref:Uncharacterized protein n=1 Tax=Bauhinia variegata TaxID=167791 RepID=A0ACB9PR57_BAUVA|nr:hypothetical protein L6164_005531 [Bauhinia variegata]